MATRRGRGENALFKRNDGLWCARIELPPRNGKRRYKQVTSKDKPKALKKLKELEKQLAKHGDIITDTMTIADYLDYWIDNVAKHRVNPNVLSTYRGYVNNRIKPAIGTVKLSKVSPHHIRAVHDYMVEEGIASTTQLNTHRTLSKALKDAKNEGRIDENPAEKIDAPRARTGDLEALEVEEAVALLKWLEERETRIEIAKAREGDTNYYSGIVALFATYLLTGQRRGEVAGLELDRVSDTLDISWQLRYIQNIEDAPATFEYRHLQGKLYLTRPKSRAGWRVIPLVDPLKSILETHMERATPNPHGLLFTKPDGSPWYPSHVAHLWNELTKEWGIQKRVRLHDLRHTTVDLLLEAGVPEDVVAEIVGHSNITMVRAYKSKKSLKRRTEAMTALSNLLQIEE